MNRVLVVAAQRSAIGAFGGALTALSPVDLGKEIAQAVCRTLPKDVHPDEVIVGNVLGAGHGMNIARQLTLKSGLPHTVPAFTVNKVCGSGLKAITLAAAAIRSGEAACILAGGVESMSQAVFVSKTNRFGRRLGHTEINDLILADGLSDPLLECHMGITAENLASKYNISRQAQDVFALSSQNKTKQAQENLYFQAEITPIKVKAGKAEIDFSKDEHPRSDTTIDALGKLKPAFKADGTVTAGNASGINDGAAFVLLCSEDKAKQLGLKPLAEIVDWAAAGVDPALMGIGPAEATKKLLRRNKFDIGTFDLIEANEAFAAQALAVGKELEWDDSRVNVCGGAIALGHPIGASGARIVVTLLHQLQRLNKQTGLATLCIGGGQGLALCVRRI